MAFVLQERNFLTILAAAYVVVFGLLLFTYELHLECVATCFVSNMGFMFDWRGRLAFYIFAGTLAFGIGITGIVAGSFTAANFAWNLFIFCFVPPYLDYIKGQSKEMYEAALKREAVQRHVVGEPTGPGGAAGEIKDKDWGKGAVEAPSVDNISIDVNTQPSAPSSGGVLPSGWVEMKDEGSGAVYFVNNTTGEQTWERPM